MNITLTTGKGSLYHRYRALLHLILVQALLPVTLSYVVIQCVYESRKRKKKERRRISASDRFHDDDDTPIGSLEPQKFVVVLTGGKMTKSLHISRCLRSYADSQFNIQLKIIVLESERFRWCATRFSRCVDDFEVITSPRESGEAYMQGIFDACKRHNATHFLPVAAPVEAVYDAQIKERLQSELNVTVHHMDTELCQILDDKHKFGTFLSDILQCQTLKTYRVGSDDEARRYNAILRKSQDAGKLKRSMVLKNLTYDPIHRLDLFPLPTTPNKLNAYLDKIRNDGNPITDDKPWQLQEFISNGNEYAAMIVVRNNQLLTVTCCPSSASQLNYVHVEIPSVRTWLNTFMKRLKKSKYVLTGQLCFDFIVVQESNDDGNIIDVAYPIECNPRVHTQCSIYNRDDVRALFGSLLIHHVAENENKLNRLLARDYGCGSVDGDTSMSSSETGNPPALTKAPPPPPPPSSSSSSSVSSISSGEGEECPPTISTSGFLNAYVASSSSETSKSSTSSPATSSSSLNVYWFYNEFFKIFPNSWLLQYNNDDEDDLKMRRKLAEMPVPRLPWANCMRLFAYLPGMALSFALSLPVWIALVAAEFVVLPSSSDRRHQLSAWQHARAMLYKFIQFGFRLTDLDDHVEGDCWHLDPIPFVAKNHVQVPSRLLATLRTGAEWKKIDFAIGKVVEVGGD